MLRGEERREERGKEGKKRMRGRGGEGGREEKEKVEMRGKEDGFREKIYEDRKAMKTQ